MQFNNVTQIDLLVAIETTRSLATAEKQRVSCACLPIGWLTLLIVQCTEHRRIAEVVLFLTFKRSDSRSAGRKRILS